ncbi:beta-glucosidase [Georgenia satyanarayanai]|uniref:Beta-glucosidase n=1 Tax=Georgenia satyanarayanai TaxID=860221 RepID=A0A2Y9BZX4_9MICO|nr:glycoside hydrolase family 3 N-terminal domain-containing protein [Georgenia satyanarayanai]PYF98454.1 beta-glucosidase [Georgenia satyanarayanai]SSA45132.1 beta-glucosidase [Georgenia satyanarayanai]
MTGQQGTVAPGTLTDAELLAAMTLEEKLAQLVGLWEGRGGDGGGEVAPMQDAMQSDVDRLEDFAAHGLGHLTRVFGTRPVDPVEQARALAEKQRWLRTRTRLGIPALVHEECLTGLATWQATTFPAPPAWGATFDGALVEEMGRAIGGTMRALGVHQGLAPVLDVVRDARWGRVEECLAEDPSLVGELGTAYVRGLQEAGVVATLKHFVGYSASRAGRNLAPVHAGPREVADVLLPPFEMAVRDGGAGSVMSSYNEIDGVPVTGDAALLTGLLREQWGFPGTVVADYFGVAFLHTLHGSAADLGDAAAQALVAGVDVELPTGAGYVGPLAGLVRSGAVEERYVDRAVLRVLRQKRELGLLDEDAGSTPPAEVDLDPPASRDIASRLAEESVVLVANGGALPLGDGTVALVGPNADSQHALFGCYSFANHVLARHPEAELGLDVATVRDALVAELGADRVRYARGCDVREEDTGGFAEALATAEKADVVVAVMGDLAGMFGRGTSGEGCDVDSLELPGVQRHLLEALLDLGKPVVLVLVTGRPYAVGWAAERCAAVVQSFFPGQEGARALAGVLSGRVNPSGRLPVSLPASPGSQPYSYLHPPLGGPSSVSNLDTRPVAAFGHGLSYTSFEHSDFHLVEEQVRTDGTVTARVTVRNVGDRSGADVVQVYARTRARGTTRPTVQLLGFARVPLEAGAAAQVELRVPAVRLAWTGADLRRAVRPGEVTVSLGRSCAELLESRTLTLTGEVSDPAAAGTRLMSVTVTPEEGRR